MTDDETTDAADATMTGGAALDLAGEPWQLLQEWLPANEDPDRPQLTLSTVTPDGRPDARTVLLTEFDRTGFYFHTDARSGKAAQLAANPAVALTFLWPGFIRQLTVQGTAAKASGAEIAAAYRSRSAYLQQLAWQNTSAFAQLPLAGRIELWRAYAAEHPDGFAQPPTWTGYLVRPGRLTFWHGNPQTASLRVEFTATKAGWRRHLLPG